jgi:hypothetical protein
LLLSDGRSVELQGNGCASNLERGWHLRANNLG